MKIERLKSLDIQEAFILMHAMKEYSIVKNVTDYSGFSVYENGTYDWYGCRPEIQEALVEMIHSKAPLAVRRKFYNSPKYRNGVFRFRWRPQRKGWDAILGGTRTQTCIEQGMSQYTELFQNLVLI